MAALSGCGAAAPSGSSTWSLTVEGRERMYRAYVPPGYEETRPSPVVLNFHGFGSSAESQEEYSGFRALADTAGFLLVTPQAIGTPRHWHVWDAAGGPAVDDVAFVSAVLDDIASRFCVDSARIYAAGISNGASMVSLLACLEGERIAAVAFVAGATYPDTCNGTAPIPVLAFHGTADFLVPFEGSPFGLRSAVPAILDQWAAHNACSTGPTESELTSDVTRRSFEECAAEVELYVIKDGGHTWPGTRAPKPLYGRTTQTIDASQIIWAFFSRHRTP